MAEKQFVSQYDGTLVKVAGSMVRVDKGAVVPDGADPDHVDVLVERGMLVEGEPAAGFTTETGDAPFALPDDGPSKPASRSK